MEICEAIHGAKQAVRKRIEELQTLLASLDHVFPGQEPAAVHKVEVTPTKVKAREGGGRISKYFEPLGKALFSGPLTPAEINDALGVVQAQWDHVAKGRPDLFRKTGEGKGSTWGLTDAGRREFEGKA